MSVYIFKESSLEGNGEIRVWSPFKYAAPPTRSRLWRVDSFADSVGLLGADEWAWLGAHCGEMIEVDPGGTGECYTDVKDRDDWDVDNLSGTPGNVTYGSDDGQATAASNLFKAPGLTEGMVDDYATVDITVGEGDSLDIVWPTLFVSYVSSQKIQLFNIDEPMSPVEIALNGRGFDSGGLMSNSGALNSSRSFVRPWDEDQIIAPFNWKSNAVFNARLEIARNLPAGSYSVQITQTGSESSDANRRGIYCGRVISRRPSSGWLTPESGDIAPRFEEYEPYNANNARFNRDVFMSRASTLPCATSVGGVGYFGGVAHGDVTSAAAQIRVDTGGGLGVVTLASLSNGWNGPYEQVEVSWSEASDNHDIDTDYIYLIDDDGLHATITQTHSTGYSVDRVYMAMMLEEDEINWYPPEDGEGVHIYQPTHYEYRLPAAAGTKTALNAGGTDTGHDDSELLVLYYDNQTDQPRNHIQQITAVAGGNFATNSEKQWRNTTDKFYTTVADSAVTTEVDDVLSIAFDAYFAEPGYLDRDGPSLESLSQFGGGNFTDLSTLG